MGSAGGGAVQVGQPALWASTTTNVPYCSTYSCGVMPSTNYGFTSAPSAATAPAYFTSLADVASANARRAAAGPFKFYAEQPLGNAHPSGPFKFYSEPSREVPQKKNEKDIVTQVTGCRYQPTSLGNETSELDTSR